MATDISHYKDMYRKPNPDSFPEVLNVTLVKEWGAKYGENPHQRGAVYYPKEIAGRQADKIAGLTNLRYVRSDGKGKGGLSVTNTMDISRAMEVAKFFDGVPAWVIMKHNMVSGFARETEQENVSLDDLFRTSRDCDRRSNYGCTALCTRPIDKEVAEAFFEIPGFFVDVLAAPGYEGGVVEYIERTKKDMRIAEFSNLDRMPKFVGDDTHGLLSVKEMPGGRFAVQDIYLTRIRSDDDLVLDPMVIDKEGTHVVRESPTNGEIDDAITSWYLNISGGRSNGVFVVKNGVLVSAGAGQVERVGAVEQMIVKGMHKAMDREGVNYNPLRGIGSYLELKNNPFVGAVCSSDGFFPFGDSIELLGRVGVTSILQPFGSNRDGEVIDKINRLGLSAMATGERGFGHF